MSNTLFTTGLAASTTVNALTTGMIVFRIFKVTRAMPTTTSFEQTLGSTGGRKFRHIMFIIIESGMALLAIQVVRMLQPFIPDQIIGERITAGNFLTAINQVLNVIIIRSVFFCFFCVSDNHDIYLTGHRTNDYFCAGSNEVFLR